MFGLSMWEIAVIAIVILFVVGPKRLPDVAKSIGKGYGEFKRSFSDLKQSVNLEDDLSTKKNTNISSTQSKEDRMHAYTEQFRSQWEDNVPQKNADTKLSSIDKKD